MTPIIPSELSGAGTYSLYTPLNTTTPYSSYEDYKFTVKLSTSLNALRYDETATIGATTEIYEMFLNFNTSMLYFYDVEQANCTSYSLDSDSESPAYVIDSFLEGNTTIV